jgi:hypothetical protein
MGNPPTGNQPSGNQQSAKEAAQGVKDLTGALASTLKALGVQDTQLIQGLGGIVAAALTYSSTGALGVAAAAVGFLETLISLFQSSGSDEVQKLGQALEQLIQQFEQAAAADAVNQRVSGIGIQVGVAAGLETSLQSLSAQLPLSAADVSNKLTSLAQALAALAPPDESQYGCSYAGAPLGGGFWLFPSNFQTFWDDSDSKDLVWPPPPSLQVQALGYGKQAPAGANVFNYTYVLPAFLYLAAVFVSLGAAIDPKLKQNWADSVVRPTACFLRSVHDNILKNGLKELTPGPWTDQTLASWTLIGHFVPTGLSVSDITPTVPGQYSFKLLTKPSTQQGVFPVVNLNTVELGLDTLTVQVVGVSIEYGVVEQFSGYSSMATYTLTPPFDLESTSPGPYNKFQVRLLKRWKDVYMGVGLVTVLNVANNLNALIGDPPFPGGFADWSIRKDIVPLVGQQVSNPDGSFSLRALQNFLLNTQPTKVQPGLFQSLRDVLDV